MKRIKVPEGAEKHFASLDELLDSSGLGNTPSSEIVLLMTQEQITYYTGLVYRCGFMDHLVPLNFSGCRIEVCE